MIEAEGRARLKKSEGTDGDRGVVYIDTSASSGGFAENETMDRIEFA